MLLVWYRSKHSMLHAYFPSGSIKEVIKTICKRVYQSEAPMHLTSADAPEFGHISPYRGFAVHWWSKSEDSRRYHLPSSHAGWC
jgi:hypothetical protein